MIEKSSSDIVMKIKNYKLIKDFDQTYSDARILLVTGKNEIGKTSLIRGLIENLTAKSVTSQPVTEGEKAGSKSFTVPDKNGNPVTIIHEFTENNAKGSFYAIDYMGRKIKSVTDIRNIIGIFEELSIDTFYTMQQSAEGRRKIIKSYFYPLLQPEQREKIEEIDILTNKGGDLFDGRTATNSHIKSLESIIHDSTLSPEEKLYIQEYENIAKNIEALKQEKERLVIKENSRGQVIQRISDLKEELDKLPAELQRAKSQKDSSIKHNEEQIEFFKKQIAELEYENKRINSEYLQRREEAKVKEDKLTTEIQSISSNAEESNAAQIDKLSNSIIEASEIHNLANIAFAKQNEYNKNIERIRKAREQAEEYNTDITRLREQKETIIKKSNLPSGLKIDGDDFTWKDFKFNDAQISKSSAMLIIAEILCNIVESKVVYIGEKALFDKEKFSELVKIAAKYNKIPVLEQVIDNQTEIKVITEVEG